MLDRLRQALAASLLVLSLLVAGPAAGQTPPAANGPDPAQAVTLELDQIEQTLQRTVGPEELAELRRRLDPALESLAVLIAQVEPRLKEAADRLSQLGPKPADNAPPETPEARQRRDEQTSAVAALDARLRALKVLQVRAEQLSDRIIEQRRRFFTDQLLARTSSVLDPRFWSDLSAALPRLGIALRLLLSDWGDHLADVVGPSRLAAAAASSLAAAGFLAWLYGWLRRRGLYGSPADVPETDLAKVLAAFRATAERALVAPTLIGIALVILATFDLVLPRAVPLVPAAILAVAVISAGRGIMQGALAPGAPAYRLVRLSDRMAEATFDAIRAAAWIIGIAVIMSALAGILVAPVAVAALIPAFTASAIAAVAVMFLRRTTERETDDGEGKAAPRQSAAEQQSLAWVRPALWLAVTGIVVALVAGYLQLAAFVASRLVTAVVIASATAMVLALIDAVIAEWLGAHTLRGRRLSASIGIRPERLDLIGTLLGGVLWVAVLVAAALLVLGPWGLAGGAALDDAFFGLRLRELRGLAVSLGAGGLTFAVGFLMLRAVLGWVRERILPRTGMDAGLQNSVATILGYAGFALVIGLALRQIGFDLSNVAIIAGALSVGVGFGLQSIVSNFVSGLILLAERPIRVGDSIMVKGEEGHVRKISVRSTEIETFERATVILPNADLISGVVKNWTLANTLGRVTIAIRVPYEADADVVQEELLAAAGADVRVAKEPPPRVFLMRFADLGLEFELRCVIVNVEHSLTIRSDLQLAILRRLRARGIILMPTATFRDAEIKRALPPEPPEAAAPPA